MNITGIVSLNNVTTPAVPNDVIVEADGKYIYLLLLTKNPKNTTKKVKKVTTTKKQKKGSRAKKHQLFEK